VINSWWNGLENERYWLEVTGRSDIGVNLKAPQANEGGDEFWSYSLLKHVNPGDTVFHYDRNRQEIIARSKASTKYWEDTIVWAARGQAARAAGIEPHTRPGWYVGLDNVALVEPIVRLDDVRNAQARIVAERDRLEAEVGPPLYFPFELGAIRPLRPMQGYRFKLPGFFVDVFPQLVAEILPREIREHPLPLGSEYRPANEETSVAEMDPFAIDPALIERGHRGHAATQNALAAFIERNGIEPRSAGPDEPSYDLGWIQHDTCWVAEVKSLTEANEEKQLRLGLGQLLRYRQLLRDRGRVRAVLAVERQPLDDSWQVLCQQLDILLAWPPDWDVRLLE
jgi:hypothetical protein